MAIMLLIGSLMAFVCHVHASAQVKVACIGNSITYGSAIDNPEEYSYPAQLQRMLGDEYIVGKFGKPGATLLKRGHRPYNEQTEYAEALAFVPDIAVIHLGVNDTDPRNWPYYNDDFVRDYLSIIEDLRKVNPDVRILIARLTPITQNHYRYKSGTRVWRDKIQDAIEQVAEIAGVELIDFNEPLVDQQRLIPDNVHPNEEGYGLLASTVYKGITGNYGGLKLPVAYTPGMVLQRYKPLTIKGTANAGSEVTVNLAGNKATTTANNRGKWQVTLPPLAESTGLTMTVTDGTDTIVLDDIAVGEVWLASGQSNMMFTLGQASTAATDVPQADDPLLRFFDMKPDYFPYGTPMPEHFKDSINQLKYFGATTWQPSTPESAKRMSAVAYYFGRMLRDSLNVPVGIIHNSIGGSPAEAWIDIETLQHGMPEVLMNWRTNDYLQPWVQRRITENVGPVAESRTQRHPYEPTYLFATGIRPLGAYPIAGVIWYQGESNEQNIEVHEQLFPMVIDSWRRYWNEPSMPFYYAQLSSISRPTWPDFRDSQRRMMYEIPNVGMAVTHDWGDSLDVHPRNKKPVGERLARWALNKTYSQGNTVPSGPLARTAEAVDGAVIVTFDYGMGMTSSDGKAVGPFELAEYEGLFYPAEAEIINDNQIKVTSMYTKNPRYVRYAWQPFTHGNLVNDAQLPASTFKLEVLETPDREAGIASGVSAAYAGLIDGKVVSAGGCNFPENPMAPGSKKRFYQVIYGYDPAAGADTVVWTKIGELPEPLAYGASATTPKGLVIVGGNKADGSATGEAWLITLDAAGAAKLEALPAMPCTIDNTYGCAVGTKVYVAGGNCNGKPSNSLWCLDLSDAAPAWKELKAFPGNPRVQPVLAAGKNAKGEDCLYMWGGFVGAGEASTLETDGYCYSIKSNKWQAIAGPKEPDGKALSTGGGAACTLTDGSILVVGGVNADIFLGALRCTPPDYLSHPIEWYKFNPYVSVYNPAKGEWTLLGRDEDTARAGAAIVAGEHNDAYVIGGELKPRIRTPYVSHVKVK